jgi:CheY-like chemotaxis protein
MLLVDDNVDALELLAEALRASGHEVEVAIDGPTALAVLDRFTPSAMVLDIGLPVMDGCELASRIRARPEHRATMLIALTGYGHAAARERSRAAGFDLHLVKPIDFSRLLSAVEETPAAPRAPSRSRSAEPVA